MHIRATQRFHHGLLLSTPKEKKRNKTIYMGKLPISKRRTRNLFGFSFNYYYYMHGKKNSYSYNYFFWFFLRLFKHTRRKQEKEINNNFIIASRAYFLQLFHCTIHASLFSFSCFLLVCLKNLKKNQKKLVVAF